LVWRRRFRTAQTAASTAPHHKPAGHRAGVLGVLEKQSSGDGAVARAVDKENGSAFMIVLLSA
jgi:hypothetical protein